MSEISLTEMIACVERELDHYHRFPWSRTTFDKPKMKAVLATLQQVEIGCPACNARSEDSNG